MEKPVVIADSFQRSLDVFFTDGPDFASAFSFSDVESIENYFLSTVPMTCMPVVYEDNIDDMSVLHKT